LLARICGLAQTVEVFHSTHGPVRAEEVAEARRGERFDPALVDAFLAQAREGRMWETWQGRNLARPDLSREISRLEPTGS